MNPATERLLSIADLIEGYSRQILLRDLLEQELPVLLTYQQAAERVQVSQHTIAQWVCDGKLTRYGETGRGARVNLSELMALFAPSGGGK